MYVYKINITKIYDGDTITADVDLGFNTWLHNQKFRLIEIDTEELRNKDPILKEKAYAARDYLRSLVIDRECTIKCHGKGKYGRWLGELFIDGLETSVNTHLIETGHARKYPN